MKATLKTFFLAFLAAIVSLTSAASASPSRIVSLNVCTDQLLIDLVARNRIAAVSRLATDKQISAQASSLAGLAQTDGSAESVFALSPDLVIAGEYTNPATIELLKRLGLRVLTVPLARTFDDMYAAIRQIADATGETARGEDMIRDFVQKIASARTTNDIRPTAIAYEANGLVSGGNSLVDAVFDAAGFRNQARDVRIGPGGRYPLERLVTNPPDLIVLTTAASDYRSVVADNLRHPALAQLLLARPNVRLPMSLWLCATPKLAEAVQIIAHMRATSFAQSEGHP